MWAGESTFPSLLIRRGHRTPDFRIDDDTEVAATKSVGMDQYTAGRAIERIDIRAKPLCCDPIGDFRQELCFQRLYGNSDRAVAC
ncbi:MAG: hypothetical protein DLM53_08720 [Candidatus Eremiobacter antarcticus]|nr:MAG: hypothetical protein DLM53_08720 [Candidatus Eremiobacter sp. RRmetagenome_bin22]